MRFQVRLPPNDDWTRASPSLASPKREQNRKTTVLFINRSDNRSGNLFNSRKEKSLFPFVSRSIAQRPAILLTPLWVIVINNANRGNRKKSAIHCHSRPPSPCKITLARVNCGWHLEEHILNELVTSGYQLPFLVMFAKQYTHGTQNRGETRCWHIQQPTMYDMLYSLYIYIGLRMKINPSTESLLFYSRFYIQL